LLVFDGVDGVCILPIVRTTRPIPTAMPTMAPVESEMAPWSDPSAPATVPPLAVEPTPPALTPTPSCADIVGKAACEVGDDDEDDDAGDGVFDVA
jgi:hypothetical protein